MTLLSVRPGHAAFLVDAVRPLGVLQGDTQNSGLLLVHVFCAISGVIQSANLRLGKVSTLTRSHTYFVPRNWVLMNSNGSEMICEFNLSVLSICRQGKKSCTERAR